MALADEFEKRIWSEISKNDNLRDLLQGVRDETKREVARILQSDKTKKEIKKRDLSEEHAEILTDIFCDVIGKVRQERKKKAIKMNEETKYIVYKIALNHFKSKEQ